jgi:hypothetical protein
MSGRSECTRKEAAMAHAISRPADILGVLALVFVAVCLAPAGAHLAEMPNKLALSAADYMVVQQIYRGWALFGIPIFTALALSLAYAIAVWRHPPARRLALLAFLALAATQAVFWTWTYPMNVLTQNWTVTPADLDAARRQWEYSHAVNAVITFAALVLVTLAVVRRRNADGG